jgi:predicted unusual protein kinase regulating ubiquinone biosynthesis (AarF/ABC1/UbiB family)
MNQNLFDDRIQRELVKYTDSVPYTEEDIDYDSIMDLAFDNDLEYKFSNVVPFKSGMISLVFKLYSNKTGEPFILKMKRNNIDEKLNDAIDELKWIIYLFSFFPQINNIDASTILNKNIDNLKEQTDFNNEVRNMIEAKSICEHLDYVHIPTVYPDITEKYNNLILMEYVPGVSVSEVKEEDYIPFAKLVSKYGIVSLSKGAAHGDLHPGNLLFIRDESGGEEDVSITLEVVLRQLC